MILKRYKKIMLITSSALWLTSVAFGAEYIVPPDYDNTVNASKSHHSVLISNLTPVFSSNTYSIGGESHHLKCVSVPKIQCRNGRAPSITTTLRETPALKDSLKSESIPLYDVKTAVEDAGTTYRVCAAALGVVSWDNSTMTQDATTGKITYTYIPLASNLAYYFFTDATGDAVAVTDSGSYSGGKKTGSDSSYVVIETEQSCY